MADHAPLPIFPAPVQAESARSQRHRAGIHRASGAVPRLIAGICAGVLVVSALWYLLQLRQPSSALVIRQSSPVAAVSHAGPPQGVVLVTVSRGDTLWAVSALHRPDGIDQGQWVREVVRYNDMPSDAIFAGQVIAIPKYK
ncbi:LysM peptidoglycan-binding domain-containing protein [Stomatohabitans albus]|uniref:LysM peptidoglycan-binding domain-containing protein n=1 Tax=Stomatohabitans albus TaxID=3110766 RepID=UPI00300C9C66